MEKSTKEKDILLSMNLATTAEYSEA